MSFSESDLIINSDGRIYHLNLKPEELANNIILVGDPGRAQMISKTYLHNIQVETEHRGLFCATGQCTESGGRLSVITSGMGTPSLEIVLQEIVALAEVDFKTRMPKSNFDKLKIIRVGTSGGLQSQTTLGTLILSSYAIGLDNTGLFYESPFADSECQRLELELAELIHRHMKTSRFQGRIRPYVSKACSQLLDALKREAINANAKFKVGITATNSGFFANQGRDIARIKPAISDLDRILADFNPKIASGDLIENMEMESSFLFHFINGLGHSAASICPAIANRATNTFAEDYQLAIEQACVIALRALR